MSSHTQYYEDPHLEFNKAPERKAKEKHVSRREQPLGLLHSMQLCQLRAAYRLGPHSRMGANFKV